MARTLVWPWHGQIKNGVVKLRNGSTQPYSQPLNSQRAAFGPGDTHLIVVPDIEPITDDEQASAPAGGEYWAGRALLAGNTLYNRQLDGWIYQALDGSRWRIAPVQRSISDASSTIQFTIARFGEFYTPAETRTRTVTVPQGYLPVEDRARYFADLGSRTASVIQVHSVSASGRHAVLAWSAFNTATSSNMDIDTRMRPYAFAKVSITGSGAQIALQVEMLYGPADVLKVEETINDTGQNQLGPLSATDEIDREPIFDDNGVQIGNRITYNYSSSVEVVSGPGWQGPMSQALKVTWLVMLPFEDEEPVPRYFRYTDAWAAGGASFSVSTSVPRIANVYNDGTVNEVQFGVPSLSGGALSTGNSTFQWDGPGGNWSRSITYGSAASLNGTTLTLSGSIDDQQVSQVLQNSGFQLGERIGGLFAGSGAGRVPFFGAAYGSLSKVWYISLYSNNLIAIAQQVNFDPAKFEGAFTPDGFTPYVASYPVEDVRHFGSFNPATSEFVVGSTAPVNWT